MSRFCEKCGKPLAQGEVCSCAKSDSGIDVATISAQLEKLKNQMGIGDPLLNKGDAFEKGKMIVPDCIKANEGEVSVKQYEVADMKNRILGIPYTKAIGRLQVTNKRVIFRAPGRCLAGRTTVQHEFAIDELAGLEARREYVFNFWNLLLGIVVAYIGGALGALLIGTVQTARIILALVIGAAGCVPFFMLKKKWLVKLLCLGFASTAFMAAGSVLMILGVIAVLFTLFTLFVYAIKPNLVLEIKTKGASEAITIKRKKGFLAELFGKEKDHTGYAEVTPLEEAEVCIREVNAVINDIQKLGDFGIEKWKV